MEKLHTLSAICSMAAAFNNWRSLGCAGPCGRAFELISIG